MHITTTPTRRAGPYLVTQIARQGKGADCHFGTELGIRTNPFHRRSRPRSPLPFRESPAYNASLCSTSPILRPRLCPSPQRSLHPRSFTSAMFRLSTALLSLARASSAAEKISSTAYRSVDVSAPPSGGSSFGLSGTLASRSTLAAWQDGRTPLAAPALQQVRSSWSLRRSADRSRLYATPRRNSSAMRFSRLPM